MTAAATALLCYWVMLQIAGVDAARTLLSDLLSCTAAGRGVGELALYWADRGKLEEVGTWGHDRNALSIRALSTPMQNQFEVLTGTGHCGHY